MIRILRILVVFAGLGALGLSRSQEPRSTPDHLIDLVANVEVPPSAQDRIPQARQINVPRFGRQSRPDHDPDPPQPLSLRVVGLDRTSYAIGDRFAYELLLANDGSSTIFFPASTHADKFSADMPGAMAASVTLLFDGAQLGRQVVGSQVLYGAPNVPGSIIEVRAEP